MALTTEQEARLNEIFEAVSYERAKLNDWEKSFFDDQVERYEKYKSGMSLSPKQWAVLDKMYDKVTG